jgi:HSP20 family protein
MAATTRKSSADARTGKTAQQIQTAAKARSPGRLEDIEQLFDDFLRRGWPHPWRMGWPGFAEPSPGFRAPRVDVIDRDGEVVVQAEIPGVDRKDLDISVSEDSVTIRGETRSEEQQEEGEYCRCEISRGSFSRTVALPAAVDGAKANAIFRDGILELTLPKMKVAKRHRIAVK